MSRESFVVLLAAGLLAGLLLGENVGLRDAEQGLRADEIPRVECLRELLDSPPSEHAFGRILALFAYPEWPGLLPWPDDHARDAALDEAERGLVSWPEETRHAISSVSIFRDQEVQPWARLVRWLSASRLDRHGLERLLLSPHFSALVSLEVRRGEGSVGVIGRSPHLRSLRRLVLSDVTMPVEMFASPNLSHLEHLSLKDISLDSAGLRQILGSPLASTLREFALMNAPGLDLLDALLSHRALLPRLRHLDLFGNHPDSRYAAALIAAPDLCHLEILDLTCRHVGGLTEQDKADLRAAPHFARTCLIFDF